MVLKLKIAIPKQRAPVNRVWSTIVAFVRARRQHDRDWRILSRMNDHNLRDIGLNRSRHKPFDRAR
jgi:uncharacterized protein YjiS (DUF1127 family)